MGDMTGILLVYGVTILIAGIVYVIIMKLKQRPEAVKRAAKERRNQILYRIFISTPFLKTYTKKCYYKIRQIAAAGETETRSLTVTTVTKGLIYALITGLICTIVLENPISIGIGWVGAYAMLSHVLVMQSNALNKKLLMNFAPWVGLLREEYMRTESIPDSFTNAETPECLQTASAKIVNVLESPDPDYELNRLIQEIQCSYIRTLAMAAVKVHDRGDANETDKSKESTFVRALKYIEEDSYSELERIQELDEQFSNTGGLALIGGLPTLCLVGILGTKIVPTVMLSILSMLQAWYGGMAGQVLNVVICALSVVGFGTSSKLMSHAGVTIDDRSLFINKMLKFKPFAHLANMAAPKKLKKKKLEKLLNDSSSCKSVLEVSAQRLVTSIAMFVLSFIACIAATAYQGKFFTNTTQSFSLMASDDTAAYTTEEILAFDARVMQLFTEKANGNRQTKAFNLIKDEDLAPMIKEQFPDLGDVQVSDQITRLRKKYDNINGAYFKWWMTLLCVGCGVIGFMYPEHDLKKNRLRQVQIEERDDFMQLQTLCTILANADCDVMETLDEMSKLSKLYKKRLLGCYLNYATNPEKELARLSARVKLGNFKQMIKKISSAVDQLSMAEAFDGMDIERKHILEERKIENHRNTLNKREQANTLLKFALGLCLVNTLLAPILIVGGTSLVETLGQMQSVM